MFTRFLRGKRRQSFGLEFACVWLALWALQASPAANASPISIQFDTTVANTRGFPLGPIEISSPLPFSLSVGDSLSVTFTYEPSSGSGSYLQSGELLVSLGSQQLFGSPFQITVTNNTFGGLLDARGRIVGNGQAVDRGAFLADQIIVACPGGIGSYCGTAIGHDELRFTTQLVFEDDVDLETLSSNDLIAGSNLWNAFRNREMRIGFNNGVFLGAYITTVREVPEPRTIVMAILMASLLLPSRSFTARGAFSQNAS
jgi:hypothetical protein